MFLNMNRTILDVTKKIVERSISSRYDYVSLMKSLSEKSVSRSALSCGNLAHAMAACSDEDKSSLIGEKKVNIGIITAYNDMLSAHKPYEEYPKLIKLFAAKYNAVAQVAGGVPAMCDGVTQGESGMDLSLFSRDIIALSTAIGLSHNMFEAAMCLGICDKIVPGELIGALKFGYMPIIFVPGGPMKTGISNEDKAKTRQDFASGKIDRKGLLESESKAYHSSGTCTFYGTANSNQMLMEIMGLQLPGSSFVNPDTPLRNALTEHAVKVASETTRLGPNYRPLYEIVSEKTIVNAIIGLLATGGSTNHTLHLIAIAKSAGIIINWEDFSDLSSVIPSLVKMYPNGSADVNYFQACGGMSYLIKELLDNGLLHDDVQTILGEGLHRYTSEPFLREESLVWRTGPNTSLDKMVLTSVKNAFSKTGGLKVLRGNLGMSVIKISAVKKENWIVQAPAVIFEDQKELLEAFNRKELNKDFIAVVRYQGPKVKGMPELHRLTPILSILQNNGYKVALVTDGRMSGASGKVPAAIHLAPEAIDGGILSKLKDGDMLRLDAEKGILECLDEDLIHSRPKGIPPKVDQEGSGRELFENLRNLVGPSDQGASVLF
jgi:phosphogluconate dehydratase